MVNDSLLRWQNVQGAGIVRKGLSWLLSSILLKLKSYDILLVESFQEPAIILSLLKLFSKKVKVYLFLTNEVTYLLKNQLLSQISNKLYKSFLKRVDGIICIGLMIQEMVFDLNWNRDIPVRTIINGIEPVRFKSLNQISPQLGSKNILVIANGSGQERVFSKGLDIMLNAFSLVCNRDAEARLIIVGEWSESVIEALLSDIPEMPRSAVNFVGFTRNIEPYMSQSSIYLHIARGESWGISILEAMRAGLIPIVSNVTGAKEVIEKVDSSLIVPLSKEEIADKIIEVFNSPPANKIELSNCLRLATNDYEEKAAVVSFSNAFYGLVDHQL